MVSEPSITLFDNEAQANLISTLEMIEAVLIDLGHIALESRCEIEGAKRAWRFEKGSALITVELRPSNPLWRLRVSAVVMTCVGAIDRLKLYRHLLTLNANEVTDAAFAVTGDDVLLIAERNTVDLDQSEVYSAIERVQTIADTYDNRLVKRFGGVLRIQRDTEV